MGNYFEKQFILKGLGCANCASKIENKISKLQWVEEAEINFTNRMLRIKSAESIGCDRSSELQKIIDSVEDGVKLIERVEKNNEIKETYLLKGLHCAGCAARIESKINELPDIKEASLDFASKKLTFEKKSPEKDVFSSIEKIVTTIEPDVSVIPVEKGEERKVISMEGCSCGYDHSHSGHHEDDEEAAGSEEKIKFAVGIMFYISAFVVKDIEWLRVILFFISYVIIGGHVVVKALKNIAKGQMFDENFLMTVATIGAFAIREYPEAVAVMIFYQIGEMFQEAAVKRSRKSISDLMDIRPDYAVLKDGERKVSPQAVRIGDLIIVRPGERVPLDGIVKDGESQIDTSALTGESVPRMVKPGEEVLSGCINNTGVLTIEVTKSFNQSTVSKILELVENAGAKKAPTEKFITKFSRYYTPAVVFSALALVVIPSFIYGWGEAGKWMYRGLSFLVVSCPCALVVSIPLGFFGGIGAASKNGILVKGGNYLEALTNVDTVVFDKTGTLTKGVFEVAYIYSEKWIQDDEMVKMAAFAESYSSHPIAKSIISYYGKDIAKSEVSGINEISGHGVEALVDGKKVSVGNDKLMKKLGLKYMNPDKAGTVVHIAVDGRYAGYIVIADEIKADAKKAIKLLKNIGVRKTVMLTGDNHAIAENVSRAIGIDECYDELLPQNKVEKLEELDRTKQGKMIFVGDGINDAPVLARADIGIAMGGVGSDAAIEAADVVIMNDEPSKIYQAIRIAKRANKIVWQNIIIALSIKLIILFIVAVGKGTMWEAVFGDVGVALIAILNSMRVLKSK